LPVNVPKPFHVAKLHLRPNRSNDFVLVRVNPTSRIRVAPLRNLLQIKWSISKVGTTGLLEVVSLEP
jgi:hypothetical protein